MDLNNAPETENLRGGANANAKRKSFKERAQQVSVTHPPSKNPAGFIAGSVALVCCALPAAGCGICCILLIFALSNCVTIATIVIGTLYNKESDCPVENISLLLIVGGIISLVASLLETISKCVVQSKQRRQEEGAPAPEAPAILSVPVSLLRLASLCWLIAACVKIYSVYEDVSYDPISEFYCHKVLYRYAFWLVTITLAITVVVLGIAACVVCCAFFCIALDAAS